MKIIYTFLLALGMVMAGPELEVIQAEVAFLTISNFLESPNLLCVNKLTHETLSASFIPNTTRVKITADFEESFKMFYYTITTPFGNGIMVLSHKSELIELNREYRLTDLPDDNIEALRSLNYDESNDWLVTNGDGLDEMQFVNDSSVMAVFLEIKHLQNTDKIRFQFPQSGLYKLEDLILAMVRLIKSCHQMVGRNEFERRRELDKLIPEFLVRV
jgi:hypothetical protein